MTHILVFLAAFAGCLASEWLTAWLRYRASQRTIAKLRSSTLDSMGALYGIKRDGRSDEAYADELGKRARGELYTFPSKGGDA